MEVAVLPDEGAACSVNGNQRLLRTNTAIAGCSRVDVGVSFFAEPGEFEKFSAFGGRLFRQAVV